MAAANELNAWKFDGFQSKLGPTPSTLASAATVAPDSFITYITGTTQVATITPPLDGEHMLVLVFTNASPGALLTSGNILKALTPVQNVPVFFVYDPATKKYIAK